MRDGDDILQLVQDLERQLIEMKTAQIVGSDVVKVYRNRTANAYDYSLGTTLVGGSGSIVWKKIRFTPEKIVDDRMTAGAFKFAIEIVEGGSIDNIDFFISQERIWQSSPSPVQEWWVAIYASGVNVEL